MSTNMQKKDSSERRYRKKKKVERKIRVVEKSDKDE